MQTILEMVQYQCEHSVDKYPNLDATDIIRISVLIEELGEIADAITDRDIENAIEEICQVISVICRFIDQKDPYKIFLFVLSNLDEHCKAFSKNVITWAPLENYIKDNSRFNDTSCILLNLSKSSIDGLLEMRFLDTVGINDVPSLSDAIFYALQLIFKLRNDII